MARQRRIEFEGAFYHVMARGDRREAIVDGERDAVLFVETMAQACLKTGWRIHAWVLMSNHYHWVVETPAANLVAGMKWFQNTFTRRINCRHQRWGHLFGGRYKAILVQADAPGDYLRSLIDYVHLNPARAGLVNLESQKGLLAYRWSSLTTAYAVRPANRPPWVETAAGFALAGATDCAAGRRALVERLEERVRSEKAGRCGWAFTDNRSLNVTLRRGWYWGTQAFADALLERFRHQGTHHRNRNYPSSQQGKDAAALHASRILRSGMTTLGLEPAILRKSNGSYRPKVMLARLLHERTTVSQQWIAQRLFMGSASNVSQQLRRLQCQGLTRTELAVWRRLSEIES